MWARAAVLSVLGVALVLLGGHTIWTRGAHLDRVAPWLRHAKVRAFFGIDAGLWGVGLGLGLLLAAWLELSR
jgi:hypothetical protein